MTTFSLGESFYDTIVWIRYCKMQFVEEIIHGNKRCLFFLQREKGGSCPPAKSKGRIRARESPQPKFIYFLSVSFEKY